MYALYLILLWTVIIAIPFAMGIYYRRDVMKQLDESSTKNPLAESHFVTFRTVFFNAFLQTFNDILCYTLRYVSMSLGFLVAVFTIVLSLTLYLRVVYGVSSLSSSAPS